MKIRTLSVGRPCCYRRFTLTAIATAPVQFYARRCRPCAMRYQICRETVSVGVLSGSRRIVRDRFSWLNRASRELQTR